jgi:hypothetical protein
VVVQSAAEVSSCFILHSAAIKSLAELLESVRRVLCAGPVCHDRSFPAIDE